ncbi:bifunctional sugar-1-phosphate nucleotidylyltransferase/acetyltransferase [Candidatus Halobonum tyrrellensis]|uniref:Bifunctional protein GlmU n=1 Tax=Candidatus Halobonum tyrrellensis G22 TaxID=1324957 RepID=V4HGK3_9EURY|nr:bifunctional sugar-1-phosphate nucleotidylyltransferase/acetyltransferase [Candidatus Halobonum tyrrellensis]ESP86934.1 UDP-N-acetylglucosamine diphosphorylase/glucosamine-1-phosphate N-acetyltransferase [Candidatus Halobonum tyrrellensis G22]
MHAVVLAAGRGTRIRPLSDTRPKPLLPVCDRPLAAEAADAAVAAGADELVFVVGYEGEQVRETFGDRYRDVPVSYVDQGEPEGTADAVAAASDLLDGPFAVLNGDNLYGADEVAELFDAAPSVGVTEVDDPSSYGVVSTDDDGGRVTGIVEKPDDPPSNLANVGAYVFPEAAIDLLDVGESERGERELTDVLAAVAERTDVTPVTVDDWMDVGHPWELLAANERRLADQESRIAGQVHETAELHDDVVVEEGATVRSGCVIEGPVRIREGATVGPGAYVRGATLVGPDAKVGHGVEVKNSVLMAGATVPHLTYVGDSVLGRDVNLGAGTQVANLRHDEEPVEFTVKGERSSTGRRKFGVVAGDRAKTGVNTSLAPGVRLSVGATTDPGEFVDRDR